MTFQVRITDADATQRVETVDAGEFWIGAGAGRWAVALPLPRIRGLLVQVRHQDGNVEVRAEPGLPVEVRTLAGRIGSRFEPLLEGEVLRVGGSGVELCWYEDEPALRGLDARALHEPAADPDLAGWFESLMSLADRLDGVRDLDELVHATLEAVLATTGVDRCFVRVDAGAGEAREWFLSHVGGREPFGVSRSLVDRVRGEKGVVFVPESARDPEVAGLSSVRKEGISSSLAVPLRALGRSVGVLYADCVEVAHSLGPADFQKAALLGRMLAGAIGSRSLVRSVLDRDPDLPPGLESSSPACKDMVEKARLFAPTDYTILVRGETGSGKEVLARAVHALSSRAAGDFVAVNCAAIPSQLMESELFGHVKGSFTGAMEDRAGFFVAARGGTLFLDEIGDMDLDLQAKILRALETREVVPVGGTAPVRVDVRILAATHRNLEEMVEQESFREDLYYRLRELEIRIPPLRERPEDIPRLAESFLGEAACDLAVAAEPRLAAAAVRRLMEHDWRGNIRELKHAMRTALVRAGGGELLPEHLDLGPAAPAVEATAGGPAAGATWKDRLDEQEREALRRTLEQAGGNLTKGALLFGLPRTTYRERLVKHGLL